MLLGINMAEKYLVVKQKNNDKLMIISSTKFQNVNHYILISGPDSYEECLNYIESGNMSGGPYIPPVEPLTSEKKEI